MRSCASSGATNCSTIAAASVPGRGEKTNVYAASYSAASTTSRVRSPVTTSDLAGATDGPEASDSAELTQSAGEVKEPLLQHDQAERYRNDWQQIQSGFVDEPRKSVEEADRLVADLMQRLAAIFAEELEQLENQWDSGDDVSTEDLRVALTRYRSFFDRLLST